MHSVEQTPIVGDERQRQNMTPKNPVNLAGKTSVGKRLRSNVFWAAFGRFLSIFFLFALHSTLAHRLPQTDYGQYVLLESVTLVLSIIMLGGLPSIVLRTIRIHLSRGDTAAASEVVGGSFLVFSTVTLLTVFFSFVFMTFAGQNFIEGLLTQWFIWVLAWSVLVALLRLVSELARGYEMLPLAYLVGGQNGGFGTNGILLATAVIFSVTNGLTLPGILSIQLIAQFVCVVPAVVAILRIAAEHRPQRSMIRERNPARKLLTSGIPLLMQQLVVFGLPEFDTITLGSYAPAEQIALYGPAKKLVFLAIVPLLLVNHAIQPFIAEFYAKQETSRLRTLVRGTATFAGLPSLIVLLTLLLVPRFILTQVFGEEFAAAETPLRILCAGAATFVLTGSCGLVLTMTGHERAGMFASMSVAAIYLCTAPFLIRQFGIRGAAISAAGLQIISNSLSMLLVYYYEGIWTSVTFSTELIRNCVRMIFSKDATTARN